MITTTNSVYSTQRG